MLSSCSGGDGKFEPEIKIDKKCVGSRMAAVIFDYVSDAELDTAYISNQVTISGLTKGCSAPLYGGGNQGMSSINGGPFKSRRRDVNNGDRVRLRQVSPSTYGATSTWQTLHSVFRVTTRSGRAADAPKVSVLSPADQSTLNASRIVITGIAEDPDGVNRIEVKRTASSYAFAVATSTNGFATWQAEITLGSGANLLTISSTDSLNNHNPVAAQLSIDNKATVLVNPKAIESDMTNLRLLAVDESLRALIAIDLSSGQFTALSNENLPDANNLFVEPVKVVVNNEGSIAWVIDRAYDDIVQVNLATGARTLLADTVGIGTPTSLSTTTDFVLDEINGRILLVMGEGATAQVLSLDLASGQRSVLSDAATPDSSNPLETPQSLALDPVNNRLLVVQRNHDDSTLSGNALLSIDPSTGQRELLVDATVLTNDARDADLDIDNGRVLILSTIAYRYLSRILTFDLAGNTLTTVSSHSNSRPTQIARDPLNNRLLFLDDRTSAVMAVDLETGEVSIAF